MTPFQFFEVVTNSAITCAESNATGILALRGIDRRNWPKPWPLVADNHHGTLNDAHVRIALASLDDSDGQHELFTRGWEEWLEKCGSSALESAEGVRERIRKLKRTTAGGSDEKLYAR